MFSDILGLLRFITDPKTRGTLAQISRFVSKHQKNWRDDIKTAKSKLSRDEPHEVSAFANHLFGELKTAGISNTKIEQFQVVFAELVNNAFEHGCKQGRKCHITVRCTYSRWFIRLEVEDSGKGFDLEKTLADLSDEYATDRRQFPHGLQVVNRLVDKLYANRRGNIVTAFLSGQDSLGILPAVEKYKEQEILVVRVTHVTVWRYLAVDWKPLRHAVENAPQSLILIDCTEMGWDTKVLIEVRITVAEFKERRGRFYAFVVGKGFGQYFDLEKLSAVNCKVFYDGDEAKMWLLACVERIICLNCGAENRKAASFCNFCGTRLSPLPSLRTRGSICPNCGAENRKAANFCNSCGTRLPSALPFM